MMKERKEVERRECDEKKRKKKKRMKRKEQVVHRQRFSSVGKTVVLITILKRRAM